MRRFRYFDHTGDLGVLILGSNLSELFAGAAAAMTSVITDRRWIRARELREMVVRGGSREELLVSWLQELLYLFETRGLLFRTFEISMLGDTKLRAVACGEHYDPGRHPIKTTIKAVTFHQLKIEEADGQWRVRIVFDL
jgi:SHS2 domain-containing protein